MRANHLDLFMQTPLAIAKQMLESEIDVSTTTAVSQLR